METDKILKMIPHYKGIEVFVNKFISNYKYVPVKCHKRKRIQKKFIKRYGYKRIEMPRCFRVGNKYHCNDVFYARMIII